MLNSYPSTLAESSYWITAPNAPQINYGIYHFRKSIHLSIVTNSFIIHISADNRYRLFINGKLVSLGPVRGDLSNWYYDTINIAGYLNKGGNTVAVQVWNMGKHAAVGQISSETAFFIQGDSQNENAINTDASWKVFQNAAYQPCSMSNQARLNVYMVIGPGDKVDANDYPWNWENIDYDDTSWQCAELISYSDIRNEHKKNGWKLIQRNIPLLHEEILRVQVCRRSTNEIAFDELLHGENEFIIHANQELSILLDHTFLTVAYPEIIISAGKNASIQLIYAESLYDEKGFKRNRNEIENKKIYGNHDNFTCDGGVKRTFRPLSIRAYRYLQLNITTKDEPLIINDIYSVTSKYPFELKASFKSSDASLQEIWNAGWRTAQLCAGEVYYDTPYYEQLQYVADTRIQAMISLYTSGDDRLMRKAILDFYNSITTEGLTQSRYPSNKIQIIPAFSLFWVSMIHDYWMHRKDDLFVGQFLPAIQNIIKWFEQRIDPDKNMLGPLPHWNFVDWDNFDERGTAPGTENGNSAIVSLHYSYTLLQAAELCAAFSDQKTAKKYQSLSDELNRYAFLYCFNEDKGLIADTPEQNSYSQHAGIWAILSGAIPAYASKAMIHQLMNDKSIGQVTYFYRFYFVQALKKAGLADLYYSQLTPWREMLELGLTTFSEKPEPTRSDCHGWSASPLYDFLATVCGIMPSSPGFETVLIKPALGELTTVEGSMPHPLGMITVKIKRTGNSGAESEITLPPKLNGSFQWGMDVIALHEGYQYINCPK